MDVGNLRLTMHALERFVQRTKKQYRHIDECLRGGCQKCDRLKLLAKLEYERNRDAVIALLLRKIGRSKEFIPEHASRRVGYKHRHFAYGELEFVIEITERPNTLVTVSRRRRISKTRASLRKGNRKEQ